MKPQLTCLFFTVRDKRHALICKVKVCDFQRHLASLCSAAQLSVVLQLPGVRSCSDISSALQLRSCCSSAPKDTLVVYNCVENQVFVTLTAV